MGTVHGANICLALDHCYVTAGRSVFDVNGTVVGPLTRAGLRRATKGSLSG